jgi:hypothetical protein
MPLSTSDVDRISALGYAVDFFTTENAGELRLKNLNGRCVFHDGQRCTIYDARPKGCRLYPAVFDEDSGEVLIHRYCPQNRRFKLTPAMAWEVIGLIQTLDEERETRLKLGKVARPMS